MNLPETFKSNPQTLRKNLRETPKTYKPGFAENAEDNRSNEQEAEWIKFENAFVKQFLILISSVIS